MAAVRLNCNDDRAIGKRPGFQGLSMKFSELDLKESEVMPFAHLVGIPLRFIRIPPGRAWMRQDRVWKKFAFFNLLVDVDIRNSGWGWVNLRYDMWKWEPGPGSAIVFRDDYKDVPPAEVEDISIYCQLLMPLFEDAMGGGSVDRTRDEVMSYVTPERFEEFRQNRRVQDIAESAESRRHFWDSIGHRDW